MISHSETIPVSIEKVWEHFLLKIENPQHFVPGVSSVSILEKVNDFILRSMDLTTPDGTKTTVIEKITWTPFLVKYTLVDHPVYSGYVDNVAEKISDNETKITYTLHWTSKTSGEAMLNQELIKNAVLKTVDYIENLL